MSDRTTKNRIEYILSGKDESLSRTFSRAADEAEKFAKRAKKAAFDASPAVAGPTVDSRFSRGEQYIRDRVAGRISAMRETAARSSVEQEINRRLFGGPEDQPYAFRKLGNIDQGGRDSRAAELREQRSAEFRASGSGNRGYGGGFDGAPKQSKDPEGSGFNLKSGLRSAFFVERIGAQFAQLGAAAKELTEKFARGEVSLGQMVDGIARSVPVIGGFISAGRDIRVVLDEIFFGTETKNARKDEQQDNRELQTKMREKRDAKRQQIVDEINAGGRSADDTLNFAGKRGFSRGAAELENEHREALRQVALEENKVGQLSPDQQVEAKKQIARQKLAVDADYFDKKKQLEDDDAEHFNDLEERSLQIHADAEAANNATRLEMQGRYFDARLANLTKAADREIEEAKRARDKEQKGLDPSSAEYQAAEKRFEKAKNDARSREYVATAQARDQDNEDIERRNADHTRELEGTHASIIESRLRAGGDEADAEKVAMAEQHQQRLAALEQRKKDELNAHGERRTEIEKQYAEDVGAENESFGANIDAFKKSEGRKFAPKDYQAGSESALLQGYRNPAVANDLAKRAAQIAEETHKLSKESAGHLKTVADVLSAIGAALGVPTA